MRRVEEVMQFQANWLREHPQAKDVIVNVDRFEVGWLERYDNESWETPNYFRVSRLMQAFGADFMTIIRMVFEAQIPLFVTPLYRTTRWEIASADFPTLWKMHGTKEAYEARKSRPTKLKGPPLPWPCPHCGKTGRQFRSGKPTKVGSQSCRCGHCRRNYTHNRSWQPPIESPCPRCGAKGRQRRTGRRPCGSQIVRCLHCLKYYTIRPPSSPPSPSSPMSPPSPISPIPKPQ